MKKHFLKLLVLSTTLVHFPAYGAEPHKDRTVVVISLDGFPAYALDDPRLPIPTLRQLAREGSSATSMRPINPTVTWPNHTALVTGVNASIHHVLFNGSLTHTSPGEQPRVDPQLDKDLLVQAPTVYDIAFRAGLTTAQVDWVAIHNAKTITWQFPEIPSPAGRIEQELIAKGTLTREQVINFEQSSQAWQDQMWTAAAVHILQEYKPNLLLFHLLTLDDTNHEYGPMTNASLTAMAFVDAKVKQIIDTLKSTGMLSSTTVLIVSDHGFRKVDHALHPLVLIKAADMQQPNAANRLADKIAVMSEGGTASIYVPDASRRNEITSRVRTIFANAEGVGDIYDSEGLSKLGWPTSSQSNQGSDILLTAKPGYYFSNGASDTFVSAPEEKGNHGFLNTDPEMQAIFIAWGANIQAGKDLGTISNLDVAPTIASLLGLTMNNVSGHPIEELINGHVRVINK